MVKNSKRLKKQTKKEKKKTVPKDTGLQKKYYPKTKRELCDFDYIHKLNKKEKEWLNTFMEEYAKAYLNHGKKRKLKKTHIKEVYQQNNARNRDMWNKYQKIDVSNIGISEFIDQNTKTFSNIEEALIDFLDLIKNYKK